MAIFSRSWNTLASTNSSHIIHAVVTDLSGNQFTTSNVTVTVNNPIPEVPPEEPPVITPPDPQIEVPEEVIEGEIPVGAAFYNTLGEFSTFAAVVAIFPSAINPDAGIGRPPVPVIDTTIGFSEFIQIIIANSGSGAEGCEVWYQGVAPDSSTVAGLYVKNKSADSNISITRVDYSCAISDAGGFAPNGSISGTEWDVGDDVPQGNFDLGSPGFSAAVSYLGGGGGELIYTTSPSANAIYNSVIELFQTARLTLGGFSPSNLGVSEPELYVGAIARGFVVYIDALGRTVFPPILPALQGTGGGYFGFFGNIIDQPLSATISVRFSTGRTITRTVEDLGGKVGWNFNPEFIGDAETHWELEDYFLFISEETFSNDLDSPTGRWEDMLNTLPNGIYVTALARFHEIISTTIDGIKLDPDTVYYYRVGSRRPVSLATEVGTYIYSETLSEEATGQLSVAFSVDPGEVEPEPAVTNSIKQAFVFGQAGSCRVEQDAGFVEVVPANCVLEKWYLHVQAPATGTGSLTVNVRRNGTDLFTGGAIPTLAVGATSTSGTTFSNTALSEGDELRFDVRTIPTGPGTKATIQLVARQVADED